MTNSVSNTFVPKKVWRAGDCFAFIAEDDSEDALGDVLFGTILNVLDDDWFQVRVWCASEAKPGVVSYERWCLNVPLTRAQMERARREGWPEDVAWLRALVSN